MSKMLIAEIGVNWTSIGEFEYMLDRLGQMGVKYAKGQLFSKDYKAIEKYPQLINNVLDYKTARHLMDYAKQLGITLFWTPSEDATVDLCISLKPEFIKIAHTHYLNVQMADKVNGSKIPAIVSVPYNVKLYKSIYQSPKLLECINEYPPSVETLWAYDFDGRCDGVSLHSPFLTPYLYAAMECGANIIEVHVKVTDDCIDSSVSISLDDFGVLKRELDFIWNLR